MHNIWQQLPKPIKILAPMEDVTDSVFRQIIAKHGKPDLFFTEFVNVDGYFSLGKQHVAHRLFFTEIESPIIAQVWGLNPENYYKTGRILKNMGFDGIDINMGCPVRNVVKTGACSALIKNHSLATEIITATLEGASGLPVSVKTRIGFDKIETEEWVSFLLKFDLSAITVHGRISVEMSKKTANWSEIAKAVKLRNQINPKALIIGNGDIKSVSQIKQVHKKYGVDGVMIGRGIFENPLLFAEKDWSSFPIEKKIALAIEHTQLFIDYWQNKKDWNILKKFMKVYINGFDGAKALRQRLFEAKKPQELLDLLKNAIIEQAGD